jgi:N-acetylglucosaminyl-diphospho-decaprenol L-rhamnosyltransferase
MAAPSSHEDRPDLAIIMVNFRNAEMATRALADAERSAGPLDIEEIVVDVNSPIGDVELLRERRPRARIVRLSSNPGFAASCNAGIEQANARHLLVLGSDAFAIGDAVESLVDHLDAHPHVGLVAPLLLNLDGSPQDNVFRRFPNLLTLFIDFCTPVAFVVRGRWLDPYHVPRRRLTAARPIAHANGTALAVRAQAAADTGPLDSGFRLYLEDTEWQRRMAATGWEIAVLPSARIAHVGGASSRGFALASPYYLASVYRYFDHPRAALAVIRVAAAISRICALAAIRLGFDSERVRRLERGFGELLGLLRSDRWRSAAPPA